MTTLTIGTRGSRLALWQANHIADRLRELEPGLVVELEVIKTRGDKILDVPLAKVGGKGLFVKEIETALIEGSVDLAVHSMKDVPAELVDGGMLAAVPEREDPRDALVSRDDIALADLPRGARVGTSSLRRRAQLLERRPDLEIDMLRGNVDTRLRKLDEGQFDAIVLAAAGLSRLGFGERISEYLEGQGWLPAAGQGALGIEVRESDERTRELIERLHDPDAADCVRAERALLEWLGGGCQVPIAAHAVLDGDALRLEALVAHPDGTPILRESGRAPRAQAGSLGRRVGEALLSRGGQEILDELLAAE
ncbi:MAG: hydroxymethylbilane synthase [Myxococcales bacterium]|nr:hydroxymethylbilane synthase [Myxococcales bacterium]